MSISSPLVRRVYRAEVQTVANVKEPRAKHTKSQTETPMTATVLSDQTYARTARAARSYRSDSSAQTAQTAQSASRAQPHTERLSRIGKISKTAIALWVAQVLLAATFLFAGP